MAETTERQAKQAAEQRAAGLKALSLIIMYQNVFTTDFGKKVLDDLKIQHFYDKPTFIESGSSEGHAYREGQRAVILRIESMMKQNIEQLKERVEQNVSKK